MEPTRHQLGGNIVRFDQHDQEVHGRSAGIIGNAALIESGPVGVGQALKLHWLYREPLHRPERQAALPNPAPLQFHDSIVAARAQHAAVRHRQSVFRPFLVLEEAFAIEEEPPVTPALRLNRAASSTI